MTMLPQHGALGFPSTRLIPTDDTKTYSLQSTLDEGRYYLCSTLHQSPKVRSVGLNVWQDGVHHMDDAGKKAVFRKTTDLFLTYGAKTTFYDPTDGDMQVQSLSVGYSNNGRFHALIQVQDSVGVAGGTQELRYMYSDDDLTTVSSPVTITLPVTSLNAFRMHDIVIDLGNGVMLAPCYFFSDEGDLSQSERYVVKTTDGGANWAFILVEGPTSTYINEGSLLAVTNNIIYYMCREDSSSNPSFYCYKSTDQGNTWVNLGFFGTTVTKTGGDPPALRKFRADNGKWYAVMYFSARSLDRLYAIYGRLDNGVDGGLGLFNLSTVTILRIDPVNYLHYGDFIHYNNNMNARGAWPREVSTVPLEDNEMIYFENVTTQYDSVFAKIDPVTIYDKMYAVLGIYSWRGLVTNSDNAYGIVNSSNEITSLKSIAPGPTGQNFTSTAGGITLGDGLEFDGTKALGHATPAYFKPFHYSSAGYTDINFTLYFKVKPGVGANPNAAYGFFGNNAASSAAIGCTFFYDDRSGLSHNNAARLLISKGTVGFIIEFVNQNMITPDVYSVICVEVDLSQAVQNDKVKLYVNNVLQSTTVTAFNTSLSSSDPTYNMQIGATGNSSLPFVGGIKDVLFQNAVDLPSVRSNMNQALIDAS